MYQTCLAPLANSASFSSPSRSSSSESGIAGAEDLDFPSLPSSRSSSTSGDIWWLLAYYVKPGCGMHLATWITRRHNVLLLSLGLFMFRDISVVLLVDHIVFQNLLIIPILPRKFNSRGLKEMFFFFFRIAFSVLFYSVLLMTLQLGKYHWTHVGST